MLMLAAAWTAPRMLSTRCTSCLHHLALAHCCMSRFLVFFMHLAPPFPAAVPRERQGLLLCVQPGLDVLRAQLGRCGRVVVWYVQWRASAVSCCGGKTEQQARRWAASELY